MAATLEIAKQGFMDSLRNSLMIEGYTKLAPDQLFSITA